MKARNDPVITSRSPSGLTEGNGGPVAVKCNRCGGVGKINRADGTAHVDHKPGCANERGTPVLLNRKARRIAAAVGRKASRTDRARVPAAAATPDVDVERLEDLAELPPELRGLLERSPLEPMVGDASSADLRAFADGMRARQRTEKK